MVTPLNRSNNSFYKCQTLNVPAFKNSTPIEFQLLWPKINKNLLAILQSTKADEYTFEELFRALNNIETHDQFNNLFSEVSAICEDYVKKEIAGSIKKMDQQGLPFLQNLNKIWDNYQKKLRIVHGIFLLIDCKYWSRLNQSSVLPFIEVVLRNFKVLLIENQYIDRIITIFIDQIDRQRKGEVIDNDILSKTAQMLINLKLDESHLEPIYLLETLKFYKVEAVDQLSKFEIDGYIEYVNNRLKLEYSIFLNTLYFNVANVSLNLRKKLDAILTHFLIGQKMLQLLDGGDDRRSQFDRLIESQNWSLLSLLYQFAERFSTDYLKILSCAPPVTDNSATRSTDTNPIVQQLQRELNQLYSSASPSTFSHLEGKNGLAILEFAFVKFVDRRCSQLASNYSTSEQTPNMAKIVITQIIEQLTLVNLLLENAFSNNQNFDKSAENQFKQFVSMSPRSSAYFLAKYVDQMLCSARKEQSLDPLQLKLVISIYKMLNEKVNFLKRLNQDTIRRHLLNKNADDDVEGSFLSALDNESGLETTQKLRKLLQDMRTLSRKVNSEFYNWIVIQENEQNMETAIKESTAMSTSTSSMNTETMTSRDAKSALTASGVGSKILFEASIIPINEYSFLNNSKEKLRLPAELDYLWEQYVTFYKENNNKKKLLLNLRFSYCILNYQLIKNESNVISLCAPFQQALVLLHFNNVFEASFDEIKEATGILDTDLKTILLDLCKGKGQSILSKIKSSNTGNQLKYRLNSEFEIANKKLRLKSSLNNDMLEDDRRLGLQTETMKGDQINCWIVRIMKQNNRMTYKELNDELQKFKVNFVILSREVKSQIEKLISSNHLCRDRDDPNVLIYT